MRKGIVFLVLLLGFSSLAARAECRSGYSMTSGDACAEAIALPPAVRVSVPHTRPVRHLQADQTSWLGLARAAGVWLAELSGLWAPAPHGLTTARGASGTLTPVPPPDDDALKQHVDNPGQTAMKP
jgi:hypothetical protein